MGIDRLALRDSAEWQTCEQAIKGTLERPDLRLNA
jgi:hypothetical protein